jgi:5-methylcytosine-specific restriction endonuclease McrA
LLHRKRATPDEIKRFYRSTEWKRARYETLIRQPACVICGTSAKNGAQMNVDHIQPLHRRWDLRLNRKNLQTACASCNWGKGGR